MSRSPKLLGREHALMQMLRHELARIDPQPERMLVGYSGGSDSLALLLLLSSLGELMDIRVTAIHVDHGVRLASSADAGIAAKVCQELGIELAVRKVDPARLSSHPGVGPEEALRRERYRWFARVAAETGADLVALAHHERDQAETVLLHLARGSGLRGVSGMRARSVLSAPWWDDESSGELPFALRIWRPLLHVSPDELGALATGSGLPIADDASNQDESYRRNAMRHSVLPHLERAMPGATRSIARFASLAAVDSDELDAQATAALGDVREGEELNRAGVMGLPTAIRSRVLRQWLLARTPRALEVAADRIDAVLSVAAHPGRERFVEIGSGVVVVVGRDWLRIEDRRTVPEEVAAP